MDKKPRARTRSSSLEAVSRFSAAYHNACVAIEYNDCANIVNSMRHHEQGLLFKIETEENTSLAINMLRDFIEIRAMNMALRLGSDDTFQAEQNQYFTKV